MEDGPQPLDGGGDAPDDLDLIAYYRGARPSMRIVPASRWRDWMNETVARNANRCLPLLMANEAGWFLLNERRLTAIWSGGERAEDLTVRYDGVRPAFPAISNFGHGIVTFRIPYLFRSPPGWDLWARGPANLPRDGVAPLEGLIETDWAQFTFTMNWKLTRPGEVVFDEGEPICMVTPVRRHDLTRFTPAIRSAEEGDGKVAAEWNAAADSRDVLLRQKFFAQYTAAHADAANAWEANYFRGLTAGGESAEDHITKRRLRPFEPQD
jgi:hypothetical protein